MKIEVGGYYKLKESLFFMPKIVVYRVRKIFRHEPNGEDWVEVSTYGKKGARLGGRMLLMSDLCKMVEMRVRPPKVLDV